MALLTMALLTTALLTTALLTMALLILWQAGSAFELVCLARDPFGNIDESFEKEVTIDYDGQLPNGDRLTLPNDGVVNLKKGMARVRVGRGKQ